jgi:hypothetical protein
MKSDHDAEYRTGDGDGLCLRRDEVRRTSDVATAFGTDETGEHCALQIPGSRSSGGSSSGRAARSGSSRRRGEGSTFYFTLTAA